MNARPMTEKPFGALLAFAILCGYVVAQLLGGAGVGLLSAIAGGGQPSSADLLELAGPAALAGMLCGGAFLVFALRALGSGLLRDTSPHGIGWARGGDAGLWVGVAGGVTLAALAFEFALVWFPPEPGAPLGPIAELSATSGPGRIYLLVVALALAPPLEELLFRGVLLAGLSASWGRAPAAIGTTLAFVALHGNELRFHWGAAFGVVALALLVLWLRIRFRALGPAIAAHATYNAGLFAIASFA